jgi:methyl-accepting chemotaxis protein
MEYAPEYLAVGVTVVAAIVVIWDVAQQRTLTKLFTKQNALIMGIYEDIKAFTGEIRSSLENLSGDIQRLQDTVNNPNGLTPEQAAEVAAELGVLASSTAELAARTPEPPVEG